MSMRERISQGTEPPPSVDPMGHPLPRRTTAANSVTLKHHRIARDASLRASPGSSLANSSVDTSSPRRHSSGESHDTGQSDPMKWFDQSNENPTATFDSHTMDVDPPFFQKETDSSNEDKPYPYQNPVPPRLTTGQSSSADDYRSVIDDLTVEIQKLKEELKRFKQKGPEMLKKDKLFEIKYHGLPKRKRRELETTLRDFAASIKDSPNTSSSQRKKSSRHATRDHMYSASGSASKHASSSSGSNARPVDSAYASMSSGAHSSGMSLGRNTSSSRVRSDQKVENYLRDIPEGLYPRHTVLTDRDRKKLVVRRLEQLFTGKIGGRNARRAKKQQADGPAAVTSVLADAEANARFAKGLPPLMATTSVNSVAVPATTVPEPAREAKILGPDQQSSRFCKKSRCRDNGSASNSRGDQTESGANGNSSGSGTNTSPTEILAPDQRPTRVKDLDPDRIQVPSENMEYIRHLGLVPPELLTESSGQNDLGVQADAEGWVYLNLLCNLAQLHIVNVTPNFVRAAVNEISTKFQLSPDGLKIRWRGGNDGTRFSSDSSNENSTKSPDTEDTDSGHFKKQKTSNSAGDDVQSGGSSKSHSKFGPQVSMCSDSFHYKPLFVHNGSPNGQTSPDETLSSFGPIDDSNGGDYLSGSGTSNRRKRRHDGAIIYYSGAPFCTDLSGDSGDTSPATYMRSSGQSRQDSHAQFSRPSLRRSASGSSLNYRPLSGMNHTNDLGLTMDVDSSNSSPDLTCEADFDSSIPNAEFPWSSGQQYIEVRPLEPCGLGGVIPDDHFMVVVTTKRIMEETSSDTRSSKRHKSGEATECIIGRLASMSTSSPAPVAPTQPSTYPIEIDYVSGRIKRLAPVPLPPPVIFLPPFSTDTSSMGDSDFGSEDDGEALESSEELMSRAVNPHQSDGYPDGVDLSSGDEDGEEPEDDDVAHQMYKRMDIDDHPKSNRPKGNAKRTSIGSAEAAPGSLRRSSKSASADPMFRTGGSSVATAGGVESGYSSSDKNGSSTRSWEHD